LELAPDILILNEALFCREFADKLVDYGDVFDFPFQAAALYDDSWSRSHKLSARRDRHHLTVDAFQSRQKARRPQGHSAFFASRIRSNDRAHSAPASPLQVHRQ
jgi:hypothetical protein